MIFDKDGAFAYGVIHGSRGPAPKVEWKKEERKGSDVPVSDPFLGCVGKHPFLRF
jgi:hypothetical protein